MNAQTKQSGRGGPKLNAAERATVITRVANGEKRSRVASDYGITRGAVTQLCNARADSALHAEIAQQHEVAAIRHMLDDKDVSISVLLEVSRAILSNFAPHGAHDLTSLEINGNQCRAAVEAIKPIMDAAKMRGWIVDKSEFTGPGGAPLIPRRFEVVIVDPGTTNKD